ncbi:membrane protein insertion efficiency factor YidD [Aquabacterium sp. A7-Y]|uniref:membrane protein insertion efficiency factor YidD n=1 Tax=Aquabacterium sp. A7-Y TaxID=1349605 RepID=UPI0039FC477F
MRSFILAAIRGYQRYLSPYKGYCCAWRCHTGRASCSTLGYRAVRRYGVLNGLAILRRRTYLCGVAHRRHSPAPRRPPAPQRGDCDVGCDLPWPDGCRVLDACNCGSCDWPERKRKQRRSEERYVYIPPNSRWGDDKRRR